MKKLILTLFCLSLLIISDFLTIDEKASQVITSKNTMLVKLSPGVLSEENFSHPVTGIENMSLQRILSKYKVADLRSVFKNRYNEYGKLKEEVCQSGKNLLSGWFELDLDNEFATTEFIGMLKQLDVVVDAFIDAPLPMLPDIIPNDTNYGNQWHLNNPSNPNFDIDAEAAWNINRGRNDVIIAVLDGGVDYTHNDLDPGDRSRVIAGADTGDGDSDPMDNLPDDHPDSYAGHGTKVAGVIGARTDNGQQVAGVMWNCKIMPIKMVRNGGIRIPHIVDWDWSASAFPSDVADAIDYAVSHGAHVINLSYSFPDMGWPINDVILRLPLLYDAINNAYQNNVVITASMGNEFESDNGVRYPAGFTEQVIAVGATNPNGTKTSFSNTGSHIALSAPGSGIYTTERGGGIDNPNGTSFSAPMVAGVAGLVISQGKDRNFNLTNDDVRHIMELTAKDVTIYGTGFDNQTGHGIANAGNALQLLAEPNVLYHYNSIGGTSTKIFTFPSWILLSNRWGLAAGTYHSVDEYKITKHVTFDVPFCTPPKVWMRERESKSLDYANPNSGRPKTFITNVTSTGFDLEYVTYYVRTNNLGQTINQWIPAAPQSTNVAYTAVGKPNPAALTGPVSGSTTVCSSNSIFTLNNVQAGLNVTWQATPSSLFTVSSGSGTSAQLNFTSSGEGTIVFTITNPCGGSPYQVSKSFWVGKPMIDGSYNGQLLRFMLPDDDILPYNLVCSGPYTTCNMSFRGSTSGNWQKISSNPSSLSWSQSGNDLNFYFWAVGQTSSYSLTTSNVCGTTTNYYYFKSIDCSGGGGGGGDPCNPSFSVSPNPSSNSINIVAPNVPPPCESSMTTSQQTEQMENKRTIQSISLHDSDGQLKRSQEFTDKKKSASLDISDLRKGVYILKISDGKSTETHRIVKE